MVTKADIQTSLAEIGIRPGDTVIVHSSLKSFGQVENGAETVIEALLDYLTPEGTLVMPALRMKNFADAMVDWSIDRPSDCGIITETFRRMPGVLRSDQETHSVTAKGKYAAFLTGEHKAFGPRYGVYSEWAFSHSSPWQKMYDMNAKVLLCGCGTDKMTFRHFIEYRLVERVLNEVDPSLYDACFAQVANRFDPGHEKLDWPYYLDEPMGELLEEKGFLRHAVCGASGWTALESRPVVDFIEKTVWLDPQRWFYDGPAAWYAAYQRK